MHSPGPATKTKTLKEGIEMPVTSGGQPALPPFDKVSARDLLLSMVPFVLAIFLKDANAYAGLIIATLFSYVMLFKRVMRWSPKKDTWPMIDISGVVLYTVLLGVIFHRYYRIQRWLPTITSGVMAAVAVISIAIRKPFTAHYTPISETDSTHCGRARWDADPLWRSTNDLATGAWAAAFSCICLLSLLPQLVGQWYFLGNWLNILYNYLATSSFVASAILITQFLFGRYKLARRVPYNPARPNLAMATHTPPDIEAVHYAGSSGGGTSSAEGMAKDFSVQPSSASGAPVAVV